MRALVALAFAAPLVGCGSNALTSAGIGASGQAADDNASRPISLSRPINLLRPSIAATETAGVAPLSGHEFTQAIRHYAINKGQQPGPYEVKGADLDGDGRPEALVYFTGKAWCTRAGCTLAILTPGRHGYRSTATIRRVKPPIIVEQGTSHGWRNLVVRTGAAGGYEQTARLRFSGRGYPGNAMLAPTVPSGIPVTGATVFAATPSGSGSGSGQAPASGTMASLADYGAIAGRNGP